MFLNFKVIKYSGKTNKICQFFWIRLFIINSIKKWLKFIERINNFSLKAFNIKIINF